MKTGKGFVVLVAAEELKFHCHTKETLLCTMCPYCGKLIVVPYQQLAECCGFGERLRVRGCDSDTSCFCNALAAARTLQDCPTGSRMAGAVRQYMDLKDMPAAESKQRSSQEVVFSGRNTGARTAPKSLNHTH